MNNVLPVSAMNPIALKIAALLPPASLQQNACGLITYQAGGNQRQYQIPAKVDYILNPKTQHVRALHAVEQLHAPVLRSEGSSVHGKHDRTEQQHSVHGDRRYLRHQPDLRQHFASFGEPQPESPLHPRFRDSL